MRLQPPPPPPSVVELAVFLEVFKLGLVFIVHDLLLRSIVETMGDDFDGMMELLRFCSEKDEDEEEEEQERLNL